MSHRARKLFFRLFRHPHEKANASAPKGFKPGRALFLSVFFSWVGIHGDHVWQRVFNHFVAGEKAAMHSIPPVTQASPGVIEIWPLRGEEIGWNIA